MPSSVQKLRAQSLPATPAGGQSNGRMCGSKIFIERAAGARMWDVTAKEYVDQLRGQGPNFLGHAPPAVVYEEVGPLTEELIDVLLAVDVPHPCSRRPLDEDLRAEHADVRVNSSRSRLEGPRPQFLHR